MGWQTETCTQIHFGMWVETTNVGRGVCWIKSTKTNKELLSGYESELLPSDESEIIRKMLVFSGPLFTKNCNISILSNEKAIYPHKISKPTIACPLRVYLSRE